MVPWVVSRRIRAPLLLQVSSYSVLFLSEVCRQSVGGADQSLVLLNTVTATSHGVSPVDSREFSGEDGVIRSMYRAIWILEYIQYVYENQASGART